MSSWIWGKIAYEKYADYWMEQNGLPRGMPWVEWEDLPLEEKEAWAAAGQAVRDAA